MDGRRGGALGGLVCLLAAAAGGTTTVDTVRTREIAAAPETTSDAVVYYDFASETDGAGVVQDASGHGRDGVARGCAWSAAGRFAGGALAFTGNLSSLVVQQAPAFTAWDAYSASVWFLHDGGGDRGPQYGHKILDRTALGHDWHLSLHPGTDDADDGTVGVFLHEDGRSVALTDGGRNWADGAWHHAAVVRNGCHGELWIDGVRRATTEEMFAVRGDGALCVGNSRSPDRLQRKGWSGRLDEVRIFGRALAEEEIARLYAEGVTGAASARVTFASDVEVTGTLTVSGPAVFADGIRYVRPRGDLSCGSFATEAVPDAR